MRPGGCCGWESLDVAHGDLFVVVDPVWEWARVGVVRLTGAIEDAAQPPA